MSDPKPESALASTEMDSSIEVADPVDGELHYSGSLLARNTFYNLFGLGAPLIVAFLTIPPLIAGLGTDRFGLLSLAWMVAGYFNVFDFGIGRATTKLVAEYYARGASRDVAGLVRTALCTSFVFGLAGALIGAVVTNWVVTDMLNIPPDLVAETEDAFYVLAAAIPALLLTAGARGVLEAQQRFKLISAIKIPGSLATFLIPLSILPFTKSVFDMVVGLVISKVIVCACYLWFAIRALPSEQPGTKFFSMAYVRQLVTFGKWVSVTNLVAPLMSQMDRFIIGSVLTITAVTYYVTPYELMSKLFILPVGLITVLFPVFSAYAVGQRQKLADLRLRAVRIVLIVVLPVIVGAVALARPFLSLWLNPEFAQQSTLVMQVLAVGVLGSSIARIALSTVDAVGRPDLAAKMFFIEMPICLGLQILCTIEFGILGAALVWTVRVMVELFILLWMSHRLIPEKASNATIPARILVVSLVGALIIAFVLGTIQSLALQLLTLTAFLILLLSLGWTKMLEPVERDNIRHLAQLVLVRLHLARRG